LADSQEPSYYEIALTNRQVLVAFVILLTCVLVAFFAGVWVGRGSPASAAEARQAQTAQPTPSSEPPQELSFFNDQDKDKGAKRPDLQQMAKSPRQGTTLAQDLGVESASPTPVQAAPGPAGGNGPGEAPAPAASAPAPAPSPPATAPSTAPAAPAAGAGTRAAPGDEAGAARAAAAPAGSLFIQVFSSKDEDQARRLAKKIRGTGLPAFLSPAGGKFRVRIGPYDDRNTAQAAANRVRRDFRVDTWITATP